MADAPIPAMPAPVARRSMRDVVFGLGVAAVALLFALIVIPAFISVPGSVKAAPLSPAFLPYVLTGLIGLLGLVCATQSLIGQGVPKEDGEGFDPANGWFFKTLLLAAVFMSFWWLPELVGTLPVAIAAMAVLLVIGRERSLVRGAAVAVLVPVLVWLFFVEIAQVPLPEGPIEELISP